MKTMLVPVDFTPTSDNAVRYAVEWSKAYGYDRIILMKTLYDSVFDTLVTSAGYMHVNGDYRSVEREEASQKLNKLCSDYIQTKAPGIKVSVAVSEEPLLRSILEIIKTEKAEMVVVGSDNYNKSSDSVIANEVIAIARVSPVRVLIVPSNFEYREVKQALVPCDFNALESLNKLNSYRASSPQWQHKKLLVLNVDPKEKYLHPDEEFKNTEVALHKYVKNYPHEVYYSNHKNIINGIIQFSQMHDVQLIIAMPGKYSFLYSLTHKNISEAIYRNAQKPVLILK